MNKIGIVSTYPSEDFSDMNESAMSWYSKKLLDTVPKELRKNFIVLANKEESLTSYYDNEVKIDRCWSRKSFFFFIDLIKEIKREKIKTVHVQHEFNLFGSLISTPFVLLTLFFLKLIGTRIIVTFHGVISKKIIKDDFNKINQIRYPNFFLKICFFIFYFLSGIFIDQIIVHEEIFKKILVKEYFFSKKRIQIINIGIEKIQKIDKEDPLLRELGVIKDKKNLLYFGFLAGYKGIDLLIDSFNLLNQDKYTLFICGGKPKRVEEDIKYNAWYNRVEEKIKKNKNIIMTGFVPENDIIKYFSVADLLIIPYLQMLSASGPMALAISYGLPFIASEVFSEIWGEEICFKLNKKSLAEKIEYYFEHGKDNINDIVIKAREEREWKNLWLKYQQIYFR